MASKQKQGESTYRSRDWFAARLATGATVRQLAEEAGCSVSTISHWKARNGVISKELQHKHQSPKARQTYANRDWLVAQFAAGKNKNEIAAECRVSKDTVSLWKSILGLTGLSNVSWKARQTYADYHWLFERVSRHLTDGEIAQESGIGVKPETIARWRRRLKIKAWRKPPKPKWAEERNAAGLWIKERWDQFPFRERESETIILFFGIDGPLFSLHEIARRWETSAQNVSQTFNRALGKIFVCAPESKTYSTFKVLEKKPLFSKRLTHRLKTYGNPAWLRDQREHKTTVTEMAKQAGCSPATINNWLKRFAIL